MLKPGQPTASQWGRWAALNERWPELGHALRMNPSLSSRLERTSGDQKAFEAELRAIASVVEGTEDARTFWMEEPIISPILENMVHFASLPRAAPTPETKAAKPA